MKGGGELIRLMEEASCNHDYSTLDKEIRNIREYLYADGDGGFVAISDLIEYRKAQRKNLLLEDSLRARKKSATQNPVKKRQLCWKLDKRGTVGETILHLCFLNPTQTHRELAKRMLDIYPNLVNDIYNGDEYYGENVLHMAIANEDSELVKFVLDKGADCRARACGRFFFPEDQKRSRTDDPNNEWIKASTQTDYKGNAYFGEYPLSFAVSLHKPSSEFDDSDYISWILEKARETQYPNQPSLINLQDSNGNTALHMAVIHDKKELIQRLKNEGADLSIKNKQRLTPLTLAAKLARQEIFELILELERTEFWRFGDVLCAGYPVEDFDTISEGGKINHDSALNLIVYGKEQSHINMMDGLVKNMLTDKWKIYIGPQFYVRCILFVIYYVMAAVAMGLRPGKDYCLDRTVPVDPDYCNRSEINISVNSCYLYKPYRTKDTVRIVLEALVCFSALLYLMVAIIQIRHQTLAGFGRSLRNVPVKGLFLFACLMVIVVLLPLRFSCQPLAEDYVSVFCILLTTPYFLFLCQGFKLMGPYVVMVYKMIRRDLLRFVIIYGIFVIGFAQAMFLVFRRTHTENQFRTFLEAHMGMFIMSVGKFEDIYETFKDSKHEAMGKIVFAVYMLLVTLLLINMLIAMMANTYDEIASTKKEWFRQWARMVLIMEENFGNASRLKYQGLYSQQMQAPQSRRVFVDRCRQSSKS
ncbi:hypothetical protein SNE40_011051 [Patella caerulea]